MAEHRRGEPGGRGGVGALAAEPGDARLLLQVGQPRGVTRLARLHHPRAGGGVCQRPQHADGLDRGEGDVVGEVDQVVVRLELLPGVGVVVGEDLGERLGVHLPVQAQRGGMATRPPSCGFAVAGVVVVAVLGHVACVVVGVDHLADRRLHRRAPPLIPASQEP